MGDYGNPEKLASDLQLMQQQMLQMQQTIQAQHEASQQAAQHQQEQQEQAAPIGQRNIPHNFPTTRFAITHPPVSDRTLRSSMI